MKRATIEFMIGWLDTFLGEREAKQEIGASS